MGYMSLVEAKNIIKDSYGKNISFDSDFGSAIRECELILAKSKSRVDLFNVNDVELLCLILLERNAFSILQSGNNTPFQKIWERNMDSLLKKIPVCHKKVIYRNHKYCNIEEIKKLYQEDNHYKVNHYLTCSKEFLSMGGYKLKFIIHPLPRNSKAHNVYMLYNFGRNKKGGKPEWQIEFERGTEFEIESIKQKGGYHVVHLKELQINS